MDNNHPLAMELGSKLFKRVFHRSSPPTPKATLLDTMDDTNTDATTPTEDNTLVAGTMHFASFGVNGDSDRSVHRVSASGWTVKVFGKPKTIPWLMNVSKDGIVKLIRGFEPNQMEEKWLVYSEDVRDNGRVSGLKVTMMPRWSGRRMFELAVVFSEESDANGEPVAAKVVKLTYETHKKYVDGGDDDWAKSETQEVCNWVLGVTLE